MAKALQVRWFTLEERKNASLAPGGQVRKTCDRVTCRAIHETMSGIQRRATWPVKEMQMKTMVQPLWLLTLAAALVPAEVQMKAALKKRVYS